MYSHVSGIGTCPYIPNTQAIRAKYVSIQTGMYQYIPGMYQYMPSIRTEIHTKIHTNTEGWYWYVSVRIKFQYVHYTSLMQAAGSDCGGGREGSGGHARGRAPYPLPGLLVECAGSWRGPRTGGCQAPAGGLARTHAPGRGHNRDTVSVYFEPRARRARSLGVVRGRRPACRPAAPD